jgi:hypothetical protein
MQEDITTNKSIEKAEKLVNIILEHYENNPNCQHCKSFLKELFE